jgi:hypothetical protein
MLRHVRGCRTTFSFNNELEQSGKAGQRGWEPRKGKVVKMSGILSKAGSETPRLNPAAPSAKAKYYGETDSEPVLWRKGEKYRE